MGLRNPVFVTRLCGAEGHSAHPSRCRYRRFKLLLAHAIEHFDHLAEAGKRRNREVRSAMAVPDMEWKRMNMGCMAHRRRLDGGAGETRSWCSGATSPSMKLILVRSRTNDCCPSREVNTQVKLVFPSHRSLAAEI